MTEDRLTFTVPEAARRLGIGPAWVETGLIVTSAAVTAIQYRNVQRSLADLCRRASIKPAISHDELRHTAISLQAEAGHAAWQIADWAGTSERMIADIYRHKLTETSPLGPAT